MAARLLVGLGNPGAEYEGTRHNVGFEVLDRVASIQGCSFEERGQSLVAEGQTESREGSEPVSFRLAKPQTFMNRSGQSLSDLLDVQDEAFEWLVVCDDFQLPLGRLRTRIKGSAGGQLGLDSILRTVGHQEVPRLRCGIGDPGSIAAEEYVLSPFKRSEQSLAAEMIEQAAIALAIWIGNGDWDGLAQRTNTPHGETG
ncbi:MAG: aminoacyl-tRNA hydrolase [Planctomycetota bacterium]|nr:aminoacyl-tRNA hydrolase [Planctomycetota bacterium]